MATTRKGAFKSPLPRLPDDGPSEFLAKLDPWFVGLAQLFKENVAAQVDSAKRPSKVGQIGTGKPSRVAKMPPAVVPEWPRTIGEMLGLLTKWGDPRFTDSMRTIQQRIPLETLGIELDQALPNMISLLKYHSTIPELQWREMQGDKSAGRQVVETADVYNRWMHDQLPRGGVRFKTNVYHNLLMLYGLPGGLDRLTSRELADFFDQLCPCGKIHTPEVLRRLRLKLLKVFERGRETIDLIAGVWS